jgi:hypothetical protein
MAIGQDLLAVPFGDMLASIATAIVDAQKQLDQNTVATLAGVLKAVSGETPPTTPQAWVDQLSKMATDRLLPTFYQFADTELEVRIAITTSQSTDLEAGLKVNVGCVAVDATYAQKYSYAAQGSSLIRTRLVPVAPPEQLKALMDALNTTATLPAQPTTTGQPATPAYS